MDVSLILNVHNESLFISSTLNSLNRAVEFANEFNISTEIVIVMDNSDLDTKINIENADLSRYVKVTKVEVSNGSLSLSRNDGISHASGKYIFTADADDLISKNSIKSLFEVAENSESDSAVFMNYLIAFGDKYYVAEFAPSSSLTILDFIANNPYTSRIFISRNLISNYMYRVIESSKGYAFEDWDLINRLFADGVNFKIAPNSILFYRVRNEGMLNSALKDGNKLVLRSKLHTLDFICNSNLDIDSMPIQKKQEFQLSNFIYKNNELRDFIYDAIDDEPTILIDLIGSAIDWSPRPVDKLNWAFAFYRSLQIIRKSSFSDIVLLDSLNPGGAERYILQILDSVNFNNRESKMLVITLGNTEKHGWVNKLPENVDFLDLRNTFPYLEENEMEMLLANLLLAFGNSGSRLHLKTFVFGQEFIVRWQNLLSDTLSFVYYRFSDSRYEIENRYFRDGHIIKFLRNSLPSIKTILTDNSEIIESDKSIFGDAGIKNYKKIDIAAQGTQLNWKATGFKKRLLWASRISKEKRPELVPKIVNLLEKNFPGVQVDFYGQNGFPEFINNIKDSKIFRYKGEFNGFSEIPINDYDMLIYTTHFDGTPNLLLEAFSAGIPVVAPDVGGIRNLSHNLLDLIPNLENEKELIAAYAAMILSNYFNWDATISKAGELQNHVITNRSIEMHREQVRDLFFSGKAES